MPPRRSLRALAEEAQRCEACPLFARATQAVFGEGPADSRIVLIGEQPGDAEDRDGHPFVGPAGALLDRALVDAGLDRAAVYLTNAVKHFSWTPSASEGRGKRRIHKKPRASEVNACRPWLMAELAKIQPSVLVCLGATAVQAVLGRAMPIAAARGLVHDTPFGRAVVARHPSSVLRIAERPARQSAFDELVSDLKRAVSLARQSRSGRR